MAPLQLAHRLCGLIAVSLSILVVSLPTSQRILILTAFSLGVGIAAVLPSYDRAAVRIVGPAVLVVALVPTEGGWGLVALGALTVLGLASFTPAGMSRAVPSLGLPIMAVALRTGQPVSQPVLLAWAAAVVIMVILGGRFGRVEHGPALGVTPGRSEGAIGAGRDAWGPPEGGLAGEGVGAPVGPGIGWRALVSTVAAVLLVGPLAATLAGALDDVWPRLAAPGVRPGDAGGQALTPHPGLLGGLDVGAPVSLDDEVVLEVESDRALYWRGVTYDQWDGRRWSSSAELQDATWTGPGVDLTAAFEPGSLPAGAGTAPATGPAEDRWATELGLDLPEPITITQHFEANRAGLDVLLGSWRVSALWSTARSAQLGSDGSIRVEPLGAGATWTVDSSIVPASDDDLRRADPTLLGPDAEVNAAFGQEDHVHPAVAELARTITAEAPTTYDKIRAIEAWMDDNIVYTRQIAVLGPGEDAVHHLLFESGEGFCEQIGTAMVVMLRSLGIPARLVVGYVPSEYDTGRGRWLSRGTDAHAWAEVYFPGVGWRGFDPTAGVPLAADEPDTGLVPGWLQATSAAIGLGAMALVVAQRRLVLRRVRRARPPGLNAAIALRSRFDRCGQILGLDWTRSRTLRERANDLVRAGADPAVTERTVRGMERLLFFDLEAGTREGRDAVDEAHRHELVALVEADVAQLEWCVDLVLVNQGREGATRFSGSRWLRGGRRARAVPSGSGRRR